MIRTLRAQLQATLDTQTHIFTVFTVDHGVTFMQAGW